MRAATHVATAANSGPRPEPLARKSSTASRRVRARPGADARSTSDELRQLGVELKDYFTGLIDFPCWMDGREVYLCWRLGEPEVGPLARAGRRLRRPAEDDS